MFYNPYRRIKELEDELGITERALQNEKEVVERMKTERNEHTHNVSVECVGCKNLLKLETCRYGYDGIEYGCKLNNTCPDREEE